jgi:hypothetical protein
MGPLEAIAQAAGRCNRNGRNKEGVVRIFRPQPDGHGQYPNKTYELAASVTEMLLAERRESGLSIHEPAAFRDYYERLYDLNRPDEQHKKLRSALLELFDFELVAKEYRLIDKPSLNVVVPYDQEIFARLAKEVKNGRLTRDWISMARPHTVGVSWPARDALLRSWLEPIPLTYKDMAEDWFLLGDHVLYDPLMGLLQPEGLPFLGVDE